MERIYLDHDDIENLKEKGHISTDKQKLIYVRNPRLKKVRNALFFCFFALVLLILIMIIHSFSRICFFYDYITNNCLQNVLKTAARILVIYLIGGLSVYAYKAFLD